MFLDSPVITMEQKTLTDRLQELREEQGTTGTLSRRIGPAPRSMGNLEKVAAEFDLLPLALYREGKDVPEEEGVGEYFYGRLSVQQYFSAVIKRNLDERHWSQTYLSEKCEIVGATISLILSGRRQPTIKTLERIASGLYLTPHYLVPKRTGLPPFQSSQDSFEKVIATLRGYLYLIVAGNELSHTDLHQAIGYGERINELTAALRVRYDISSSHNNHNEHQK